MIQEKQQITAYIRALINWRNNQKRYDLKFIFKKANLTTLKNWRKN